jgi:hypothetical protein
MTASKLGFKSYDTREGWPVYRTVTGRRDLWPQIKGQPRWAAARSCCQLPRPDQRCVKWSAAQHNASWFLTVMLLHRGSKIIKWDFRFSRQRIWRWLSSKLCQLQDFCCQSKAINPSRNIYAFNFRMGVHYSRRISETNFNESKYIERGGGGVAWKTVLFLEKLIVTRLIKKFTIF